MQQTLYNIIKRYLYKTINVCIDFVWVHTYGPEFNVFLNNLLVYTQKRFCTKKTNPWEQSKTFLQTLPSIIEYVKNSVPCITLPVNTDSGTLLKNTNIK